MQLFSLLMNVSLCITASCHARSGPGVWARDVQDTKKYKEILLILSKKLSAQAAKFMKMEVVSLPLHLRYDYFMEFDSRQMI